MQSWLANEEFNDRNQGTEQVEQLPQATRLRLCRNA
jgi:hypothetical protein